MATLDDILTTQKNAVVGLNNLTQTYAYLGGKTTSQTVTSQTLIVTGSGRLVNISVIVAGTTTGRVSNAQSISLLTSSNDLVAIPNTVGVYQCGCAFTNGLIVTPGTGQSLNLTYSLDV